MILSKRKNVYSIVLFTCFFLFRCTGGGEVPAAGGIKILFAGDLMPDRGTAVIIEKHGARFLFEDVKRTLLGCDIVLANFESTACDDSLKADDKQYTFRADPELLATLRSNGLTHLNLANNHSFDFGEEGLKQTANNFKRYGIAAVGYNAYHGYSCMPAIIEKNGSKIAVFSSSLLKQNDSLLTCNENPVALADRIKVFKADYPSYIVFVCLHWGVEMKAVPSAMQVVQARRLVDAGADAVIGHHPHVVQTIEVYKGKCIFYSIGNFIFDNDKPPVNLGIFVTFTLSGSQVGQTLITPFTIARSRPELMTEEESVEFMNEINVISPGLKLKQSDGSWEII